MKTVASATWFSRMDGLRSTVELDLDLTIVAQLLVQLAELQLGVTPNRVAESRGFLPFTCRRIVPSSPGAFEDTTAAAVRGRTSRPDPWRAPACRSAVAHADDRRAGRVDVVHEADRLGASLGLGANAPRTLRRRSARLRARAGAAPRACARADRARAAPSVCRALARDAPADGGPRSSKRVRSGGTYVSALRRGGRGTVAATRLGCRRCDPTEAVFLPPGDDRADALVVGDGGAGGLERDAPAGAFARSAGRAMRSGCRTARRVAARSAAATRGRRRRQRRRFVRTRGSAAAAAVEHAATRTSPQCARRSENLC